MCEGLLKSAAVATGGAGSQSGQMMLLQSNFFFRGLEVGETPSSKIVDFALVLHLTQSVYVHAKLAATQTFQFPSRQSKIEKVDRTNSKVHLDLF